MMQDYMLQNRTLLQSTIIPCLVGWRGCHKILLSAFAGIICCDRSGSNRRCTPLKYLTINTSCSTPSFVSKPGKPCSFGTFRKSSETLLQAIQGPESRQPFRFKNDLSGRHHFETTSAFTAAWHHPNNHQKAAHMITHTRPCISGLTTVDTLKIRIVSSARHRMQCRSSSG